MAEIKRLGNLYGEKYTGHNYAGNVWDKNGLSPAILTAQGGGREPMIVEDFYSNREPRTYEKIAPTIRAEREGLKVVEEKPIIVDLYNNRVIDGDVCGTLTTGTAHNGSGTFLKVEEAKCVGGIGEKKSNGGTQYFQQDQVYKGDIALAEPAQLPGGSYNYIVEEAKKYRIRKLTPKECWRLMGFSDKDFEKAESVVSNTQLYKEAGNSIVVNVLMAIFSQMNIKGVKPWNERN